jgi:hypothetical protein
MESTIKELLPYLQKLADKLDTSATYIWDLQVRQARVELISYFIYFALLVISWMIFGALFRHFNKNDSYYNEGWDSYNGVPVPLMVIIGLLLTCLTIGILIGIPDVITTIVNPDYWALKQLLHMVK